MKNASFEKVATRVSTVSIAVNLLLAAFKFLAGALGHSGAMISDAVHSSSDVLGSLIVIIGVRLSEKESDEDHPYGHERMENVASLLLAGILAAAIVSIVVKEGLFWYTLVNARKIRSGALKAEAWHHRSDALSSVGALIGIGGALLGVPVMEPIASIVICLFILKVAVDIFREAVDKMVDHACDAETEEELRGCAAAEEGVIRVDMIAPGSSGGRSMWIWRSPPTAA